MNAEIEKDDQPIERNPLPAANQNVRRFGLMVNYEGQPTCEAQVSF